MTALAVFGINTCLYGETALAAFETNTYSNGGTALAAFGLTLYPLRQDGVGGI